MGLRVSIGRSRPDEIHRPGTPQKFVEFPGCGCLETMKKNKNCSIQRTFAKKEIEMQGPPEETELLKSLSE
ncbi:unnamed protein product [Amoebophrya sp. A120]|nr:unnamed protein product [Amoebophrya sp. A120]|eukprot:GSA120T00007867001.1